MADLEAVRAAAEPVLSGLALELVELEVVGAGRARTLRVTVDRPDASVAGAGVDLDALAAASDRLSGVLDALAAMPGSYTLEVSSPGLERPLRRPGEFRRFVGTTVSIKSHEPVSGARRHRGLLLEADDEGVILEVDGERRRFPYSGIAQARTVFEWGPGLASKPGKGRKRRKGRASAAASRSEERLA